MNNSTQNNKHEADGKTRSDNGLKSTAQQLVDGSNNTVTIA